MKIKLNNKRNLVGVSFDYNEGVIKKIKSIPGSQWDPKRKCWLFENDFDRLALFLEIFKDEYLIFNSRIKLFAAPKLITNYFNYYYLPQLEKKMKLKGYSQNSIRAYLNHNKSFIKYIEKNIFTLKMSNVNDYILHLLEDLNNTHSYANQFISAFKTFNNLVLKLDGINNKLLRPKKEKEIT